MNCNDIGADIEAYFDGAVDVPLRKNIEGHLLICSSCESSLKQLQAMRSLLERDEIPEPSASLDAQVMHAFRDRRSRGQVEPVGWLSLITGSIRIPKPLVAATVAGLALTSFLSFQFGKRTADRIVIPVAPANTASSTIAPPLDVNQTEGASRDERQSGAALPGPQASGARRTALGRRVGRKSVAQLESLTLVSQSGTNYSTRASLDGFEPLTDANVRVVRTLEQK